MFVRRDENVCQQFENCLGEIRRKLSNEMNLGDIKRIMRRGEKVTVTITVIIVNINFSCTYV